MAAEDFEKVVIRFAGDSGDGMQLTGTEFTQAAAVAGNDLSTFPDYPAEIRAPAGTLAGVSAFQVMFASQPVHTPGDNPDVLVAMNPAALKVHLPDVVDGGMLIVNTGAFTPTNLQKAGFQQNPLEDSSLGRYRVYAIDITKAVQQALKGTSLGAKDVQRCKNFWALGLMFWLYNREPQHEIDAIRRKFVKAEYAEANILAFRSGFAYGEATEMFDATYRVKPAAITPGTYRNINGNEATALGFIVAARRAGLKLYLGSYPITPASDILHTLSSYRNYGVVTVQAEDEIAAVTSAIGAAFAGALAITSTSGPGLALKSEGIGLAVMTELPLVIIDVQRGGPSTGLPTKTEQSDLLQALWGRNGDCPVAVVAASSPADCFDAAIEASRIAIRYMTPVILLTDGYIANGAEPWLLPDVGALPKIGVEFRTDPKGFAPYLRDPRTLARPWALPGTAGLEHRIGGLEKEDVTGNVSYDPLNHDHMVKTRARKIAGIQDDIAPANVEGPAQGELLIVAWGGTLGAIRAAREALVAKGVKGVAHVHLRHIHPLPPNLGHIVESYKRILVPELNNGQLVKVLRAEYLVDAKGYNKIQGKPFKVQEIVRAVEEHLRLPANGVRAAVEREHVQ
ncbi:MAG: 2-oxoacid:acceptor oxidoreductase subunit alpha [Deltaproteobacteria bacterium]|nr:2-oxoacid:acceptor oxidoreductase subunit alpha [Deltaproteobacteria bacterium]